MAGIFNVPNLCPHRWIMIWFLQHGWRIYWELQFSPDSSSRLLQAVRCFHACSPCSFTRNTTWGSWFEPACLGLDMHRGCAYGTGAAVCLEVLHLTSPLFTVWFQCLITLSSYCLLKYTSNPNANMTSFNPALNTCLFFFCHDQVSYSLIFTTHKMFGDICFSWTIFDFQLSSNSPQNCKSESWGGKRLHSSFSERSWIKRFERCIQSALRPLQHTERGTAEHFFKLNELLSPYICHSSS